MINTITKDQYPDIFEDLFSFQKDETYHEHRCGSNYFTAWLLEFTPDNLPAHPELHGLWQTDTFIHDYEYGCNDYPDEAYRVERKTRMVEEVYYELVK